jgi:hypothetical protein
MTGLNHAATGIVIALVVRRPELALPLAFVSHFVLDSIPHSVVSMEKRNVFKLYLLIEAIAMVTLTVVCMLLFRDQWLLIGACAVAAFLPDMFWPFFYNDMLRYKRFFRKFYPFHQKIQWSETSRGWVVEALYFSVLIIFFADHYTLLHG